LAQLLAAKASGELMNVVGSNNCSLSATGATEDFYYATDDM
jgi:hypothetical protein